MRSSEPGSRRHTVADWLSQPEDRRFELIDGDLLEKAAPDVPHSFAQSALVGALHPKFGRKGSGGPGGWWILTEIDISLSGDGFRPDVAGWRRDRIPEMPKTRPVEVRPDWICEIVSESNAARDTVLKLHRYWRAGVPHYWLVDPRTETLMVYRHHPEGYLLVLGATGADTVRAEPFDAVELSVGVLFGDDPEN